VPRNNYREVWDRVPGNYIVHDEDGYYVGESEDLFRRLWEHTSRGRSIVAILVNRGGKESRLDVEEIQIAAMAEGGHDDVQNIRRKRWNGK
jgi:hypothetical protein